MFNNKKNRFFIVLILVLSLSCSILSACNFGSKDHVHDMQFLEGYPSSCSYEGMKDRYFCNRCEKYFSDENGENELSQEDMIIRKKEHTPATVEGFAASCTAQGLTDGTKCSECGEWIKTQEVINPTGHVDKNNDCICDECESTDAHHYGSYTIKVEQTCTQDGVNQRTCSVCNYVDTQILPMFNHSNKKYILAENATCQKAGHTEGWECQLCDYKEGCEKIDIVDHKYFRGSCSVCGELEPTPGLSYSPISSSGSIVGYSVSKGSANSTKIVIPSTYKNTTTNKIYPVTTIAQSSFDSSTIKEVIIGANITNITKAFYGAKQLESVTFNENCKIKTIGNEAFYNCWSLPDITLPSTVTTIGASAFENCNTLTQIPLTENTKTIGNYAFRGCSAFSEINLPTIIESVGISAFEDCSNVNELTINATSVTLSEKAFYNCKKITTINLNGAFSDLSSTNNVFLNVGQNVSNVEVVIGTNVEVIPTYAFSSLSKIKTLTFISGGKCKTIKEGAFKKSGGNGIEIINFNGNKIDNVGAYAFYECANLVFNNIEDLQIIGDYAFKGCSLIETVTLSKITTLGAGAFVDCSGIRTINFSAKNLQNISDGDDPFYRAGLATRTIITIDNSITTIPSNLFCGALAKQVVLGSNLTTIGKNAFKNCTGFEGDSQFNYNMPSSLRNIGESAFEGSNIKNVVLGSQIQSIGSSAFANCVGIINVKYNIPNYVNSATNIFVGSGTSQGSIIIGALVEKVPQNMFACSSSNFKYIKFENGAICSEIGSNAFKGNSKVEEVTIPVNVNKIGNSAFDGLTNLKKLDIYASSLLNFSESSNVFRGIGSALASEGAKIYFKEQVTTIPSYLFADSNSKISEIHFDNTNLVESNANAFYGLSSTSDIKVYITNLAKWCGMTFPNRYTKANPIEVSGNLYIEGQSSSIDVLNIPNTVSEIKPYVFYNLRTITQIKIPGSITKIGNEAFAYMGGSRALQKVYILDLAKWCDIDFETETSNPLIYVDNVYLNNDSQPTTELVIPNGVKEIKEYAFAGNSSTNISRTFTNITLPSGLEKIGKKAFYRCIHLTQINLPASLYEIGEDAFLSASSMQNITIEDLESYLNIDFKNSGAHPFCNAQDSADRSIWVEVDQTSSVINNLSIPDGIEEIKPFAFLNVKLKSVSFPSTLKTIGNSAFYMSVNDSINDSITSLSIPSNVESIGDYAFFGRRYIESVTIDEGLKSIGDRAFKNCIALSTFNIPSTLEIMGAYVFAGTSVVITAPSPIPSGWNSEWNTRLEPTT